MKKSLLLFLLPGLLWARQKPNVIIIQTDEHNLRTLGCYRELMSEDQAYVWGKGNKVETPHIDSLARDGLICTNYFASLRSARLPGPRGFPVCILRPRVLQAITCLWMIPSSPLPRCSVSGGTPPPIWESGIWMGTPSRDGLQPGNSGFPITGSCSTGALEEI